MLITIRRRILTFAAHLMLMGVAAPYSVHAQAEWLVPELTFAGASGSTIGPGGDIYVTEGAFGTISRVDPETGAVTPYAGGLPPSIIGYGGVVDIAFIGSTAYALVTLVGDPLFGSPWTDGIYRLEQDGSWTVLADLGEFSSSNLPDTGGDWDYFLVNGVHFAMEVFRGGFLVTDGHHNRVLYVTVDGETMEVLAFGNTVPTGLDVSGHTVYMAESGPIPHVAADGRVISFSPGSMGGTEVAVGAPLLVDVEIGRGRTMFALAQGIWEYENPHCAASGCVPGDPPTPYTGSLVRLDGEGGFAQIADGLNWPSSLEIIGNSAYVVTLSGGIYRVDNLAQAPFGNARGSR